jgi:glycosyltransferase involved in cell wall biosynthesis
LRHHRHFLPLFPLAAEALVLPEVDLVISSSHCVAKGVRVPPGAKHLSYVHAPMRYMWDLYDDYFGPGRASLPVRVAARALRPLLRTWDVQRSVRVNRFVANSENVAAKVRRFYGRQASVVNPPVELGRFTAGSLEGTGRGGYFLWLGALAPYKRVDLAIEAFRELGAPLWIAGSGQEGGRLRRHLPPNIRVLDQVSDAELPGLYRDARALIFPGEEDFGLTPLESQACGRPVIALARGGALETVTPQTGVLFREQSVDAIVEAVKRFEAFEESFSPEEARRNASRFSLQAFTEGIRREVEATLQA